MATNDSAIIPQPPEKPFVGNIFDLGPSSQVQDLIKLARQYGPIYQLALPGRRLVVVSSFELVDEISDEKRFDKKIWAPLQNVREFTGDGLFTAHTQEINWRKAHNILLPNFGLNAMKGYHPMMLEIAHQLLERWSRLNPADEIDIPDDMTRLTLDTIGLCGFDYRFNSFFQSEMHPFIQCMVRALSVSLERLVRPEIGNKLMFRENRQFQADVSLMNGIVDEIIKERRAANGDSAKSDLLSHMLAGTDRDTGEKLDDLNIRYQIITFLIAGHETTSGLLSFAIYYLLKNPDVLAKASDEVERVLGRNLAADPTYKQVTELKYISQILKESLRLWPTAPMFALYPYEAETVIGGKYGITKNDDLAVLVSMLHRDPAIWGSQAEIFNPDNFSTEAERSRPANAFKPFGNGQRACIGRQFALHEATLVLGMILQRFKLVDHTNYQLKVKEALTIKPADFKIKVQPRPDVERRAVAVAPAANQPEARPAARAVPPHDTPLLVLYGSNMGTAQGVAEQLAVDGEANGFTVTLAPLDEYAGKLPVAGAVAVVTASYNGTAPDNAAQFCRWLAEANPADGPLVGVNYAVFGCGNHDWAATYQAVPQLIDRRLAELGANRICARGEGDAGDDFDGDFEAWYESFWPTVAGALGLEVDLSAAADKGNLYAVEVIEEKHPNPFVLSFTAKPMIIVDNRELQQLGSGRSTRHIELALPEGVTYRTGEHLGVIAHNHETLVKRVAARFGFDDKTRIKISKTGSGKSNFPLEQPISVFRLLTNYVELQEVANRKQLKILAQFTECPPDKQRLLELAGDDEAGEARYRANVLSQRKSLIDVLEEFPACELPFNVYLEMLPPLRPRYYSISSSPLKFERICSITVGVVDAPARSGRGTYRGICSNYLAQKPKGSTIFAFVQDTQSAFKLPKNPRTPLIMIGPGTGLAPFRGFLQERAALKEQGQPIGRSLLFFGCRHPEQDFIYEAELNAYVAQGVTELFTAFSRVEGQPKVYVQQRLREQQEAVWQLLQEGAVVYVCGDASRMAPDVRQTFADIFQNKTGGTAGEAETWLTELAAGERYLLDVWASG